jgi:penicillin amidase
MMADQTDFYVEQLDAPGRKMLHDGDWNALQIVRDTIRPNDSLPVPLAIRIGMHGPLISDVHRYAGYLRHPKTGVPMLVDTAGIMAKSAVALRWAGSDPTQEMAAWQRIDEASSLEEFTAAVRLGGVPALSFVYADATGTIAYVPSARIPVRNEARMNVPNPGTDSRYNWKGYYDMAKLPTMKNPSSGYIASANNKISNSLSIPVGDLWEDPSRAIRLEQLLKDGNNFNRADMVQIQGDLLSPQMRYMVDYLLHAFPDSLRQTPLVRSAISRLRTWDGGMLIDAPEAAIAAAWLQSVVEMTYRDEMGPELYTQFVRMAQMPIRSLRYHTMIDSRWFDDVTTPRREHRDDIFRNALARALDSLHARFGNWDIGTWRFGAMHTLTFHHPFTENPSLRSIVDIGPFEVGGCNTTINNGEWRFDRPYDVTVGPSMRQIVDFADTSAFMYSVITSGASGQPMSEAYQNQTILYLSHGYLALHKLPPQGVAATSTMVLRPE